MPMAQNHQNQGNSNSLVRRRVKFLLEILAATGNSGVISRISAEEMRATCDRHMS